MKLITLRLENFRFIKSLEIDFSGHSANIYGANGAGKTTVFNALTWLMIDKASTGEKDFTPKTTETHNLHHMAEAVFQMETGQIVSFKKDFHEIWKKKKGEATAEFSGHTTDYYLDGVPAKQKEYDALMADCCGNSENAKLLTMPDYFPQILSVDDRRKILFDVCGDLTDEDVIQSSPGLEGIKDFLRMPGTKNQFYKIDDYKKIAAEHRRKINHELDVIPERIDEVEKNIPKGDLSEKAIKEALAALEKEKESVLAEKDCALNGDNEGAALRSAVAGLKTDIEVHRADYMKKISEDNQAIYDAIAQVTKEKNTAAASRSQLECERREFSIKQTNLMQQREQLLRDYDAILAERWDEGNEVCPTCRRPLPLGEVQTLQEEFNLSKSLKKEKINERGQACSKNVIADVEKRIESIDAQIVTFDEAIGQAAERISNLNESIIKAEPFESTSFYIETIQRIDEIQSKSTDRYKLLEEQNKHFTERIQKLYGFIREKNEQLSSIVVAKNGKVRIKELESRKQELAEQLEHAEAGIHLCEVFVREKVKMITDRINSKFETVQFRLFKEQINGGLKEDCEVLVKNPSGEWVAYASANTASQLNSGLEIINTLSKHFGISLPVFVDRAESVTNVADIDAQLIRLIVSAPDQELRAEIL